MGTPEIFKATRLDLAKMVRAVDGQIEWPLLRMAVGRTTLQRMKLGVGNPTLESVCEALEVLGFRIIFEKTRP